MFTGIVETTARVTQKRPDGLSIERPDIFTDIAIGSSISISGVCLTIKKFDQSIMEFDVVTETWNTTALGQLETGSMVNLERAMRADGRFDGHLVQGHIEGVGECIAMAEGVLTIKPSANLNKFFVQKGSITLNGVSLTLSAVTSEYIQVALVPHTQAVTTLGQVQPGDLLNIETDIIGRYVYTFTHGSYDT